MASEPSSESLTSVNFSQQQEASNNDENAEAARFGIVDISQEIQLEEKKKKLLQQLKEVENSVVDETVATESTECKVTSAAEPAGQAENGENWREEDEELRVMSLDKSVERNELDGKEAGRGRSRRNGKGGEKLSSVHADELESVAQRVGGNGSRRVYSRDEMLGMRYIDVAQQKGMWKEVCDQLGSVVLREYDELATTKHGKNGRRGRRFGKTGAAEVNPGELWSNSVDNVIDHTVNDGVENVSSWVPASSHNISDGDGCMALDEVSSDDVDSDEEYASIQRPAFVVEGEPNFDSGPPEDGLEYLRRVRWEAAQIPKIKIAKVDRSKFNKEQSVYMPKIPDIAKCPDHLLPLKHWEDAFLADFSELRQSLSRLDESNPESQGKQPDIFVVGGKDWQPQPPETIATDSVSSPNVAKVVQQHTVGFISESSTNDPSSDAGIICTPRSHILIPKASVSKPSENNPTLSAILNMDTVTRSTTLRKRIRLVESLSSLPRKDCMWLFALCAAVDTPLDADTSAALRSLLRKCASLLAEKSDLDDEVIMLNILSTVAGRYFGQSER